MFCLIGFGKMRFNSTELKYLASSTNSVSQKEGVLSLREKEGKLWNKTDGKSEVLVYFRQ